MSPATHCWAHLIFTESLYAGSRHRHNNYLVLLSPMQPFSFHTWRASYLSPNITCQILFLVIGCYIGGIKYLLPLSTKPPLACDGSTRFTSAPNAQRSAAWTAVPDYVHYTYFPIEGHINEDTKPKSRRLLRRVGPFLDINYYVSLI
jgi:hypothetical protein